jgi:NAD(P)-dependent dehydrogenase (short-subunit alcohol dehydrogenase family)
MQDQQWTTQDIPDLHGKVVVVTGGNTGLGFESVKAFTHHGAEVILASRSLEKGVAAKQRILNPEIKGNVQVMELDLANLASIESFSAQLHEKYNKVDILLNNAGIMFAPYGTTADGFENHMGINHLGHFALTALLLDLLRSAEGSRIVHVSSLAHQYGTMDFANFMYNKGKGYTPMRAYARSKLANLLFAYELQRRLEKDGAPVISVAAHPGIARTDLSRYIDKKIMYKMLMPVFQFFVQDAEQGALSQIRACTDPAVEGGTYYGPAGMNAWRGHPVQVQSSSASHSLEDAKKLWDLSVELTQTKAEL